MLTLTDPNEAYRRSHFDARVQGSDAAALVHLCLEQAMAGLGGALLAHQRSRSCSAQQGPHPRADGNYRVGDGGRSLRSACRLAVADLRRRAEGCARQRHELRSRRSRNRSPRLRRDRRRASRGAASGLSRKPIPLRRPAPAGLRYEPSHIAGLRARPNCDGSVPTEPLGSGYCAESLCRRCHFCAAITRLRPWSLACSSASSAALSASCAAG